MGEETTKVSWRAVRAHVHTTFRFLVALKHEITKKWDKNFSEGFGLISPDHTPLSTPAPSFPHPVPPFQQPGAPPFPQPAPPRGSCRYTGQHDHEASGSNQNSEHFDSIDPMEYAGQHQLQPDFTNSQFHHAFVDNAAPEGEPVIDDELGPIDDLLDNENYVSGEFVFPVSEMISHVTETETTTIPQEMSSDTVESMEHEAVMGTGASGAARIDQAPRPAVRSKSRKTKTKRVRMVTVAPSKLKCKGITERSGKWCAEIRVSMTKVKVWLGTHATKMAAKLAYDAGLHRCTKKEKPYHYEYLVHHLGPPIYQRMQALCHGDDPVGKRQACSMVKDVAQAHAQFAPQCNY